MNRHVLVGRFDESDAVKVPKANDESSTDLMLMHNGRLVHGIGRALDDLAKLGLSTSEVGIDLLVVAVHVHAADTRIARRTESQDGWTREIRLVVPVSDPVRWMQASPILVRALQFLTGDRWIVDFRKRPTGKEKLIVDSGQSLLSSMFDGVSLFSGGLDSLIGAIDELAAGRTPLLVSHAGEPLVSKSQDDVYEGLKAAYPQACFERMRVWMTFPSELVNGVGSEDTTRGRSFLFLSLAAACGSGLQKDFILRVPENGLIALNVPLDELRLGALSTRTTHPFYLARWNEILKTIGIAGRLENPYWNMTKGEMVSACSNKALLRKLAPLSLSCSSPAKGRWAGRPQGHCGYCLPCLIRRAALRGADATTYGIADLRANTLDSTESVGQQVRSCQLAIRRIKDRPAMANFLIHKPGPLFDQPDRHAELAGVYRRGLEELGMLLRAVRTEPK
jgi:hypothetical protein